MHKVSASKVLSNNVSAEPRQSYKLSPEQIQYYWDNGYLVVKELIDFTSLYAYKQRFIQISKGLVDKSFMTVVKEPALKDQGLKGEALINKLQDILFDDVFATYMEHPVLLDVVSQLIGDELTAMHTMFINKPPGSGRHPPHQDLYYFPMRPADKVVAAWTAVDDVHRDNGCLYVIPKSHKPQLIYEHGNMQGSDKMYHGILNEDSVAPESERVYVEMAPGDTVFFHPNMVHGSGPNITKGFRKSISCHYCNSLAEFVDVRGSVQEPIVQEVLQEAKRRGFDVDFVDVWKYRSKKVKGVRSNL